MSNDGSDSADTKESNYIKPLYENVGEGDFDLTHKELPNEKIIRITKRVNIHGKTIQPTYSYVDLNTKEIGTLMSSTVKDGTVAKDKIILLVNGIYQLSSDPINREGEIVWLQTTNGLKPIVIAGFPTGVSNEDLVEEMDRLNDIAKDNAEWSCWVPSVDSEDNSELIMFDMESDTET